MANANIVMLTEDNFRAEVLQCETPVLVDFWAAWCGPCKMIAPLIDELADDYACLLYTSGVVDFYKACKKEGIKPIIGCEVYVAPRTRFDRQAGLDDSAYHLILLVKNEVGYRNLSRLESLASLEGFYYKPRVDRELLVQYHDGLIALSGCMAGEVAQKILQEDLDGAREAALWYRDTFGAENYYFEVQNHGIHEQMQINYHLDLLGQELGIPLVARCV